MSRLIHWTTSAEDVETLFRFTFKPNYHVRLEWVEFDDLYESLTMKMIVDEEDDRPDGFYSGLKHRSD